MRSDFNTYRAIKGFYNETNEIVINLPKGLKLTYRDGDYGNFCHVDHNHYIGFIKLSDYNYDIRKEISDVNSWVNTYDFGDELLLITIYNIQPIDKLPLYNSHQEMMEKFELDKYYIIQSKKDKFDEDKFEKIKNSQPLILDWTSEKLADYIVPGEVFEISKIISIEGPFAVTLFSISTGNYFNNNPMYSMMVQQGLELSHIINDYAGINNRRVSKNEFELFEKMKNKVLEQIK